MLFGAVLGVTDTDRGACSSASELVSNTHVSPDRARPGNAVFQGEEAALLVAEGKAVQGQNDMRRQRSSGGRSRSRSLETRATTCWAKDVDMN